jgi:hypothetical protein
VGLKIKFSLLKARDYQWLLLKRVTLYIVLATTLFWVNYLGKIASALIKFSVSILSQIGWYLYFALTPFWISIDSMGLVINWLQSIVFIWAVHTIVYILKLPRWVFWVLIGIFFLTIFIFNVFILRLRVDGP